MFGKILLRRQIMQILRDEFGFEPDGATRDALGAVCDDAEAQSLSAYDAAVVFMLRELREEHANAASGQGAILDSRLAHARIGTIARLIDHRKVTPRIVDAWLGHSLLELRRVYG